LHTKKEKDALEMLEDFDLELGPGYETNVTVRKNKTNVTGSSHTRYLNHSGTSDTKSNSIKNLLENKTQDTHQRHHHQHVIKNQT
jgi:hypothetical protein